MDQKEMLPSHKLPYQGLINFKASRLGKIAMCGFGNCF